MVVREHFFLTGSASVSLDYGFNTVTNAEGRNNADGFSSNAFTRLITGYNSARWAFSIIYINNGVRLTSNNSDRELILNTGNVRISFVHRFMPGSKEKKFLKAIK